MQIKRVSPPSVEPVSLDEVKAYLRIDGTDDDALLTRLIEAARERAEEYTRRAFITQEWDAVYDDVTADYIELPRPPLISVTGVYYTTDAGEQTLATSAYYVDSISEPGRVILLASGWPSRRSKAGLRVRYSAGYGAAASSVPGPIRQAIITAVGDWFEACGSVAVGEAVNELPSGAKATLEPYRVRQL